MSRYLVSLVERARGEGAALQPRVRGRFEPGGFAEIAVETAGEAAAPPPAAAQPMQPLVRDVQPPQDAAPLLVRETPASIEHHIERDAPRSARPAETSSALPPVERVVHDTSHDATFHRDAYHSSESTEIRIDEIRSETEASAPRESGPVPHAPLPVHATRSQHHHTERATRTHRERSEQTIVRERAAGDAEPRPVHITIGRIDVRAVHPQAQQPRPPAKPKTAAPLTLDDYLRGKR